MCRSERSGVTGTELSRSEPGQPQDCAPESEKEEEVAVSVHEDI